MIELHMFPMSHFNEKVRWALDFKGLEHQRIPYLPGPHAAKIRKLSGQEQTPVVKFGEGDVLAGSTAIILELEKRYPEPRLVAADPAQRQAAMEIVDMFDTDIAIKERRGLFVHLVEEPDYLCRMFARGQSPLMRFIYRRMLPLVKGRMRASMQLNGQQSLDEGVDATCRAFDFVADRSAETGYLVGGDFTIADLTAAAILAPSVQVAHPDMRKPEPVVACVQDYLDQFADHPGAAWVRTMYNRHRARPGRRRAA